MFNTKFSGHNKIWGALPRMPPVATGLQASYLLGPCRNWQPVCIVIRI